MLDIVYKRTVEAPRQFLLLNSIPLPCQTKLRVLVRFSPIHPCSQGMDLESFQLRTWAFVSSGLKDYKGFSSAFQKFLAQIFQLKLQHLTNYLDRKTDYSFKAFQNFNVVCHSSPMQSLKAQLDSFSLTMVKIQMPRLRPDSAKEIGWGKIL